MPSIGFAPRGPRRPVDRNPRHLSLKADIVLLLYNTHPDLTATSPSVALHAPDGRLRARSQGLGRRLQPSPPRDADSSVVRFTLPSVYTGTYMVGIHCDEAAVTTDKYSCLLESDVAAHMHGNAIVPRICMSLCHRQPAAEWVCHVAWPFSLTSMISLDL
jgi:hypothetical protein